MIAIHSFSLRGIPVVVNKYFDYEQVVCDIRGKNSSLS